MNPRGMKDKSLSGLNEGKSEYEISLWAMGYLMNTFLNITTDRLSLRKLEKTDRADFFKYRSLPEVYKYQSFMPKNMNEVDDFINRRSKPK